MQGTIRPGLEGRVRPWVLPLLLARLEATEASTLPVHPYQLHTQMAAPVRPERKHRNQPPLRLHPPYNPLLDPQHLSPNRRRRERF